MRPIAGESEPPAGSTDGTGSSARPPGVSAPPPARIGPYRVQSELGRGGMARVYQVVDEASGCQRALKQLHVKEEHHRQAAALFEREFHTLAQLSHPSVIEVHDYGIAERGPYYTMELLDGGDLRALSPMPWQQACKLAFDVCSSLALLHSRRLVHRDITPRNVRCTQAGRAKLIDFGAMAPMGPGGQVVGTPAFIAPEVVHRSFTDGRADLFSLGATLYYALTRRLAFSARELSQVLEGWRVSPAAPSLLVAGIPPELDRLVMSLLNVEPALRPRSAHEVMERLHVLAGIERDESLGVSLSYLAAPVMVGRQEPLAAFRREMQRAHSGRGCGLMVRAESGLGRSRVLDAFALEAKLLGATTLRASADGKHGGDLAVARTLVEQLFELHPQAARTCAQELGDRSAMFFSAAAVTDVGADADAHEVEPPRPALCSYPQDPAAQLELQNTLARWFLRVSRKHPLMIAVDDVDRADEPSVALLAVLAHQARRHPLLLASSCEPTRATGASALAVLSDQCTKLPLRRLDQAETETLLGSVFGDVPNAALLADRIHSVALGRPRDCMALARYLVERGVITYAAGSWTLPEQLSAAELPRRATDVFRARVAGLQPLARALLRQHAHALVDTFTRQDYLRLNPAAPAADVDAALTELLSQELLRSDGQAYALSHRELREISSHGTSERERSDLHRVLAELAEHSGMRIEAVSHLLSAGLPELAVERLIAVLVAAREPDQLLTMSSLPFHEVALVIERALQAAEAIGRRPRDRCELQRWLLLSSVTAEDRLHARYAPPLLAQLERDSGLESWRQLDGIADPGQRLTQALQRAAEQHAATPEAERVYRADEAIFHLVYYVVISIAIGARTLNGELLQSLPALLEPFAPLSPAVHAMHQNARATVEVSSGKPDQAYARWLALYEQLEGIDATQLPRADLIRNAIAYGLGTIDAQLGRDAVGRWAAILDEDPLQQVNAMYLRRALCLHRGDLQNAERFRRKAEVMAVQAQTRQMFSTTSIVELNIAAMIRDLTGVEHMVDRIAPLSERHPGWRPYHLLAQAHFHRLRGDLAASHAFCERALALVAPGGVIRETSILPWFSSSAALLETLVEMDRCAEAKAYGEQALAVCAERGAAPIAHELSRLLALAEARLGDLAGAAARLDAIVAAQQGYGGHGLLLGASYEARARVAIWAGDTAAVEHYGRLAAHEYRHGRATQLGARYERLVHEGRAAGMHVLPQLESFSTLHMPPTAVGNVRTAIESSVTAALSSAADAASRSQLALELLCEAHAAAGGHLYLMRENRLALSASLGDRAPDAALQELVTSFWQRHLIEPELPTAILPEGGLNVVSTAGAWGDAGAMPYQPILIDALLEGERLLVGAAVLIPNEHASRSPSATQVTATLGAYLISFGDAQGVES